jgi:tetratricopeptide (TPR) repeat protein
VRSARSRFLVYGLAGWAVDSLFVIANTGRRRPSSLLNVPVYGLAQPLFEPVHDRLRERPVAVRAGLYGAGILAVEYASGRLLRRLVGQAPWDYGRARLAVDGLVRLDYLPLWAAFGLGLERLHDLLLAGVQISAGGRIAAVSEAFDSARLEEIERDPMRPEWIPIRRRFGIAAFGVNAWSAAGSGDDVIPEHDESSIGHEELYVVVDGHATFTVDGEEIDAPAGTIVFVRDPAVRRGARAKDGGATILTVGAKPGEAFRISPWEVNAEIIPLFDRGEFAEVKRRLEPVVEANPQAAGPLYNLACAEALLGETDAALEHLVRAAELHPPFVEAAREDEDLASLRDDPRFAQIADGES